ncbi:MAG: 1-deoxy-D-xylulose-5-phosphate reductoisomerase [Bifidobacteriaceae bacterium]|nr:1-deoxy-D-xylulose-5-phosphate reductoisomerase [Bifidobacteriaceae bacterium]
MALLGSTGSIGTQALDVVAAHPGRFEIVALAAGATQPKRLAAQIARFRPAQVALPSHDAVRFLAAALAWAGVPSRDWPRLTGGAGAAAEVAAVGADVVLNAMPGAAGLEPTLAALEAGATLALANKESLVAGGALVKAALRRPDQIVPVDSEHSAIAQCLRAGRGAEVSRLILTASGGPFRGRSRAELASVTPAQALAHPTWQMGELVTINSATLVNKALELIEAHLLFDVPADRIEVTIHPQSIVHSMVEFVDGAVIAQASPPDMRLPIALALAWPERLPGAVSPLGWTASSAWTFEPVDAETFPALDLARVAIAASPLHPAVLNAANEVAVAAFLAGRLPFPGIVDVVGATLADFTPAVFSGQTPTLPEVRAADAWARDRARRMTEGV